MNISISRVVLCVATQSAVGVLLVCSVEAHWSGCGSGEEEEVTGQQRHALAIHLASNSNSNNNNYNNTVVTVTVVCSPLNKHSAVTVLVSLNNSKYHSHSQSPVFSCLLGHL